MVAKNRKWSQVLRVENTCLGHADIEESPHSTHPSPSTPNITPVISNAYSIAYPPSMDYPDERLLTPDTTPKERKPDPFADLFSRTDYDESNSPDTSDLSSFLS